MSRHRNRNNFQNTLKDYIVPIIWGVILLLLIFRVLGGGWNTEVAVVEKENQTPVSIEFKWENTQATIEYPWDVKQSIDENASLYKWENILVTDGIVKLTFPNSSTVSLNKVAKFSYNEDGSFALYSSDAWLNIQEQTAITMKYARVIAQAWSIISLTQNEAWSTIYVLSGSAKVENIWWASTSLITWQKVSISRQFAADSDLDLSGEKWNIDSYFKGSDWFIENEWHLVIQKTLDTSASSTGSVSWEQWAYVSFKNLQDEMNIDSSSINVTGNIVSQEVWIVTINGNTVDIANDRSFVLTNLATPNKVNDLVIKVYNWERSILEKNVITVYSSASSSSNATSAQSTPLSTNTATTSTSTNSQWVTTYEVDGTDFWFTQPSVTGKFSTTASEITIRGITTAQWISKVEVNGFKLASFNGSTWRYHAFERFETLEEWTNQYKVDYYGDNGTVVYTDYYTIVKKSASPSTTPVEQTEEEIISDEASPS